MSILKNYDEVFMNKDEAGMNEVLHDDYKFTMHASGKVLTKQDVIQWAMSDDINRDKVRIIYENDEIGTNHVLPTDQTAKFSSGLGVEDYTKKTVFIDSRKKTLKKIANHTINLARQEGLEAHALSVEIRKIKP